VRKTIILFSLVLLLLPTAVFSGELFSLGFGSINQVQVDPFHPDTQIASLIDVHNWATGGEIRASLLNVNLDGYLLIQQGQIIDVTESGMPVFADDIAQRLFGMVALGFSTEVASCTTLSLAAGSLIGLDVHQNFSAQFWMGDQDNIYSATGWDEFYQHVVLAYRARLDLNLGNFSLGVHYQVPSQGYSVAYYETEALIPDWNQGKFGFSFITKFL
jgi:hypothetical protein